MKHTANSSIKIDNSVFLSVIVPIYNSAAFLEECVTSILNQTFRNLEIILIDDGSNDNSLEMINDFAERDSRIIAVSKRNGGQASARNVGLDQATGKYITFVDSDDAIKIDTYLECISFLERNELTEVVQYPSYRNFTTKNQHIFTPKSQIITGSKNLFTKWILDKQISWLVWDKVYRREVFDGLRFEIMYYEDNFMMADVLAKINRLGVIDKGLYFYYNRENSTTTSPHSLLKEQDTQKVNFKIYENLKKHETSYKVVVIMQERILNLALSLHRNYGKNFVAFPQKEVRARGLISAAIPKKEIIKLFLFRIFGKRIFFKSN